MNDVFPHFNRCCMFEPRVSMTLIAVVYIMGGATLMLASELGAPPNRATYQTFKNIYHDFPKLRQTYGGYVNWFTHYPHLMPVCLVLVGLSYIIIGIMTLFGVFFDQQGTVAMLAVWQTLITIIFASLVLFAVGYQCLYGTCPIAKKDFLSSAIIAMGMITILGVVWYFLIFINTQVVEK